jgi:hypothetical protein
MPQMTEQKFNAILQQVMETAPAGLDESAFNALVDRAVAAESEPPPPSEKPWYRKSPDDLQTVQRLRAAGMGGMIDGAMSGGIASGAPGVIGQAIAEGPKLLQGLGRRMYSGLLKAKDATVERFPDVVQDLLNARVPISQAGRQRVVSNMRRIGNEKQQLLSAADQRAMVPRETLRGGLDDALDTAIATSDTPVRDMNKLAKMERDLIPDEPGVLPSRADKIKSKLQSESDRAYRQMKMGNRITDTTAQAKTAVARRAKQAVEAIEPKMEGVNASYASNKGQSVALRDALKRTDKHSIIGVSDLIGGVLGAAGAGPAGVPAGVAAMRVLTHPPVGSRVAIGLNEIGKSGADTAMQRALRIAFSQMGQEE